MAINPVFESDEIRLTDLVRGFKNYGWFLIRKSWIIVIATLLMVYVGMTFARLSDKNWVANATFNALDSKGSIGGLMSIASSLGISTGGGTTNDVLMGIFSSRYAFKTAMLAEVPYNKRIEKVGNIYLETSGMAEDLRRIHCGKGSPSKHQIYIISQKKRICCCLISTMDFRTKL